MTKRQWTGSLVSIAITFIFGIWLMVMFQSNHRTVICEECAGLGYVVYDLGHIVVHLGQAEAGKEYVCPMCDGEGVLERIVK